MLHIYNQTSGLKESLDSLREQNPEIWERSLSNEWGRLALGNKYDVKYTVTIEFVHKSTVPDNCQVTYASFVCDFRPLKSEPYRVSIVVCGDRLTYGAVDASPAASLLEAKLLLNSTISDCDQGATFISADVKDFFLATPMDKPEYMKISIKYFPDDIIDKYNLRNIVTSTNYIYIKIKRVCMA